MLSDCCCTFIVSSSKSTSSASWGLTYTWRFLSLLFLIYITKHWRPVASTYGKPPPLGQKCRLCFTALLTWPSSLAVEKTGQNGEISSVRPALGIISLLQISFVAIQASGGGWRGEEAGHAEAHKFFTEGQGTSGTVKHHLGAHFQRFLSLNLFCCWSCSFRWIETAFSGPNFKTLYWFWVHSLSYL